MADSEVQLQPDSTGKQIDNTTVTTGAGVVYRQRISVADAAATNNLTITAAGAAKVDGSAVTQPISAVVLPLPTGAATDAVLNSILTALGLLPKTTDTVVNEPKIRDFTGSLADLGVFANGVVQAMPMTDQMARRMEMSTNELLIEMLDRLDTAVDILHDIAAIDGPYLMRQTRGAL